MARYTPRDAPFSRSVLNATLRDVRRFRPGIKTSRAEFTMMTSYAGPSGCWMEWQYENVKVSGNYDNAWECQADGWREWLVQQMTFEQHEAYQDGTLFKDYNA